MQQGSGLRTTLPHISPPPETNQKLCALDWALQDKTINWNFTKNNLAGEAVALFIGVWHLGQSIHIQCLGHSGLIVLSRQEEMVKLCL